MILVRKVKYGRIGSDAQIVFTVMKMLNFQGFDIAFVPEPSVLAFLLMGFGVLGFRLGGLPASRSNRR